MAEFNKKVFKIGQSAKTNKNGNHWTVITVEGKEAGSTKEENIFDAEIKAKFSKGPGVYKISYEKKDNGYWNITNAEYVAPLPGGAAEATGNGGGKSAAAPAAIFSPLEAKTAISAAALQAAGRIVAAEIAAGMWKEPVDSMDRAAILTRTLAKEAKTFVTGEQTKPQQQPQDEQEPVGA